MMGHPRRSAADTICDYFADLSPEAQDGLLITLAAIHRQAKRRTTRPEQITGQASGHIDDLLARNAALDLGEGTKQ